MDLKLENLYDLHQQYLEALKKMELIAIIDSYTSLKQMRSECEQNMLEHTPEWILMNFYISAVAEVMSQRILAVLSQAMREIPLSDFLN